MALRIFRISGVFKVAKILSPIKFKTVHLAENLTLSEVEMFLCLEINKMYDKFLRLPNKKPEFYCLNTEIT